MHLADVRRWFAARGRRPPVIDRALVAELRDYRLCWNYYSDVRDGGAANVAPAAGQRVYGLALCVDALTLEGFDAKEGHPQRYDRGASPRSLQVVTGAGVWAWVYSVTDAWRRPEPVWPRRGYLQLMIDAARDLDLPASYVAELEKTPTCD